MSSLLPSFCSLRIDALPALFYRLAMVDPTDSRDQDDETEMHRQSALEAAATAGILTGRQRDIAALERAERATSDRLHALLDTSNPSAAKRAPEAVATEIQQLRRELATIRDRLAQERDAGTKRN